MAPSADARDEAAKWTVMVFMGAATIDGEAPLHVAADDDITELRGAAGVAGLNIFVQRHDGVGEVSRLHIGPQGEKAPPVPKNEQALEQGAALSHFIQWSLATAEHRPQDHSMLVLWGHAYDFALGRRRTRTGAIDALDFAELGGTLKQLQQWYLRHLGVNGHSTAARLDIIGFDACDVATVEMAVQLSPYARFLLASQVAIPIPGWPYHTIFDRIITPHGARMCPIELGTYAVRRFCESYGASTPVALSFINLAKGPVLARQVRDLSTALVEALLTSDSRGVLLDVFKRAQTVPDRPYIDVGDFCLGLMRELDDRAVMKEALNLGNLLVAAQPPMTKRHLDPRRRPLVVEHGRNSALLARLHGISLYAPHLGLDDPDEARAQYNLFDVTQQTVWSALVHAL